MVKDAVSFPDCTISDGAIRKRASGTDGGYWLGVEKSKIEQGGESCERE